MSFLANILGSVAGDAASNAVGALGNAFDKLFTSDEERARAMLVLEKVRQQPHVLQAEINRMEAGHRSLFVAGWRPFIGWVCGLGLAWAFLGHPMFQWIVAVQGLSVLPPAIATENMMELILALLGLGGLRTFEKLTGRAK